MRIPRPTAGGAIFLERRVHHAEARADHQFKEFGFRVEQEIDDGRVRVSGDAATTRGRDVRDFFMAAPC